MKRHIGKGDVQSIGIMVRHAWMHRTQQHGTVAALSVVLSSGAQRARSRETMTQYLCFWWWSSCQNRTFPIYLCLYLYDMYSSNLTNSRMPFFVPSNRNMNHIEQSMVQAITWRTSQGAKRTRTGWCVRSWGHGEPLDVIHVLRLLNEAHFLYPQNFEEQWIASVLWYYYQQLLFLSQDALYSSSRGKWMLALGDTMS